MNKKRFAGFLCAGIMAAVLMLVGCSSSDGQASKGSGQADTSVGYTLVNDGALTVAASLDFPPFENLDGDKPVGFGVDLMNLLAEEMGLKCEYMPSVKFDTIVPVVSAGGKADVGVSLFTITDDRKKEIDFTDPYMDSNQGIVVMKDSAYTDPSQLQGKKIGAQSGTTGYDWASENIKGAEVIAFDEMTAIFAALQAGQIDGIAVDLPVAQYYIKEVYTDAHVIKAIPTGEQYSIVVSKENPELTKALDKALAAVKDNGKYDELYQKWFGTAA